MRSKKGGYRRLAERLRLYTEAQELQRLGHNNHQISRLLGLGESEVRDWLKLGIHPIRDRYNPNLTPSKDLAYLVGFWLGDGREAGGQKKVRFKLANREQIDHVNRLVAGLLERGPKPISMDGPFYVVDYDTSVLYDFIAQPIGKLLNLILRFKVDFLRGFFDAEGYVSCLVDTSKRRLSGTVVGVANTNLKYLRLIRKLLRGLGIESSSHTTNKKGETMTIRGRTWIRRNDVQHLVITREKSVRRFLASVGFEDRRKAEKLRDLVSLFPLTPAERYDWFVRNYTRTGRRWNKIE